MTDLQRENDRLEGANRRLHGHPEPTRDPGLRDWAVRIVVALTKEVDSHEMCKAPERHGELRGPYDGPNMRCSLCLFYDKHVKAAEPETVPACGAGQGGCPCVSTLVHTDKHRCRHGFVWTYMVDTELFA